MTIEKICIYGKSKPTPSEDVALLHVTNTVPGLDPVEVAYGLDGFHSVTTIRTEYANDIVAVMSDRLSALDYDSEQELKLAIYSDSRSLSACDCAYIAHIAMPSWPIETQDGDEVQGFVCKTTPLIEDAFETGAMAALDGVSGDANPFQCGTLSFDKWQTGHQSITVENSLVTV